MGTGLRSAVVGALLVALAAACGAKGDDAPNRFVSLPDGVRHPEGITANPANGDIYVGTFDVPSAANANPQNKLLRYDRRGRLVASQDFGTTPLLGLAFDRTDNQVYITNLGNFAGATSKIQRIAADLTGLTDVALIPEVGPPGPRPVGNPDGSSDTITFGDAARVPNAMVFDSRRNLYVSDSFQGAVFKITDPQACAPNCTAETFTHDPLLATSGVPPFGANGLAFNADESALFIANTGDDRMLRLDMTSGTKKVTVLAENINGADGIVVDQHSRLWVAANQADEVVAVSDAGRVVAKLGEFLGIRRDDGTPNRLLFPASLVIVGDDMFVTNLAVSITDAAGDEPEEDVRRWTVSHFKVPAA